MSDYEKRVSEAHAQFKLPEEDVMGIRPQRAWQEQRSPSPHNRLADHFSRLPQAVRLSCGWAKRAFYTLLLFLHISILRKSLSSQHLQPGRPIRRANMHGVLRSEWEPQPKSA